MLKQQSKSPTRFTKMGGIPKCGLYISHLFFQVRITAITLGLQSGIGEERLESSEAMFLLPSRA